MNNEDYVSYEIAKKLKKYGFDYPCYFYFTKEDAPDDCVWHTTSEEAPIDYNRSVYAGCSMPTLAQAQKWLREKKGIYVYPEINMLKKWFAKAVDMCKNEDLIWDGTMFDTYESALSAGIKATLIVIEEARSEYKF